jgi:hypothetical protein
MGVIFPLDRFVSSASPKLWAGSVETTNVRNPLSLMARAIALLVLVLPTPPLPPTKVIDVVDEDRGLSTSSKLRAAKVDTLEVLGMLCRLADKPFAHNGKGNSGLPRGRRILVNRTYAFNVDVIDKKKASV